MGLKRNAKRRVYGLSGLTADNQEISRTNSKTGGMYSEGEWKSSCSDSQREIIRSSCFLLKNRTLNDSEDGKTFTKSHITTSSGDRNRLGLRIISAKFIYNLSHHICRPTTLLLLL